MPSTSRPRRVDSRALGFISSRVTQHGILTPPPSEALAVRDHLIPFFSRRARATRDCGKKAFLTQEEVRGFPEVRGVPAELKKRKGIRSASQRVPAAAAATRRAVWVQVGS